MNQEAPPPVPFKDVKTRLVCCGVLTLLAGVLCALFVPLMLVSLSIPAQPGIPPPNAHAMIPAMATYGLLAVALVWLGVGSMMARRWARALILIFSWSVLVFGVIGIGTMAFMAPKIMDAMQQTTHQAMQQAAQQNHTTMPPEIPAAAGMFAFGFALLMMGVIFVILPILWIVLYGSKNTKATCEARDPVVRWTDHAPLPVIAMSIWMAFGALSMLLMPLAYNAVFPFFGQFVAGTPGVVVYMVLFVVWVYCALAIYRLRISGWWLAFILMLLFSVSGCLTYLNHDISELYQLVGYPKEQIEQMQKFNFFKGHTMAWVMLGSAVPWSVYLLYILKYFRRKE